MKILLAGGTGFLGSYLGEELLRRNHEVILLTRQSTADIGPSPYRIVHWPLEDNDLKIANDCDAIINLAGESIAGPRWSAKRKDEIRESRIHYTRELVDAVATSMKLKTFLSASACGFYGDRKSELLTEENPRGEGFLADVCADWEAEAKRAAINNRRVVLLRTGIVLDRNNGVLKELEPLYRIGAGGTVGSGEQFMSWIHVNDWVNAVVYALETPKISGPINLGAPEPVTNRAFSHIYSALFHLPLQLPAPAFAVKLALGEQSALVLDSQNMRPQKLIDNGYLFKFNTLKDALRDLYDFETRKGKVDDLFKTSQWIPASLDQVFEFFSDEKNLEKLTPALLKFKVEKKSTAKVMKGTLIDYKLKIHGVPMRWQSLIEDWSPPRQFIDFQKIGPYRLWHHTHTFELLAGGVLMKDFVHYRLPFGLIGRAFGLKLVKKDVDNIFSFRRKIIREMYV